MLLASKYVGSNDLEVYAASITDDGVYQGDMMFELLQIGLSSIFGSESVIYGLQATLIVLTVIYIYIIRRKIVGSGYLLAFLVFSSPVVLVGLTNSIRQSLAFLLIIVAFELRNVLMRIALFILSILMHKVSLLAIPLFFLVFYISHFRSSAISIKYRSLINIGFALFVVLICAISYSNIVADLMQSVYERYSVYIYSSVIFTEGRVGFGKILVWLIFWFAILCRPIFISQKFCLSSFPMLPIAFTALIAFDAILRGFDEFHSRLLMLNNIFVLIWFVESVKRNCENRSNYFIVLIFNIFNPATVGVLI